MVFIYCHPVVFTVAQYHSRVVLEQSRIATHVSVSFGTSDSHSRVVLVLLHARRGIVVVVFLHAQCGIVVVIFLPARCGLRYAPQPSLMHGGLPSCPVRPSVCAAVFRSARRGMRGALPFHPGRHARWSSVPPGAAYVEVFHPVWRGPVCAAVFRSVWCGPVCAAVFRSTRRGIGVPFCLARPGVRGGPPFCPARHARRSSVVLGAACAAFFRSARGGICGGLPFCPVRHMRWCSVLSGAAWYARRGSVLSGAVQCARRCCGSVIGGPGSLVALPDDSVIIGASDPRSRCCSRHTAQTCVKVGQGR